MVKSQSSVSKFFTSWKVICSSIAVTIPILAFTYTQFQWKINLEVEQSIQNTNLVKLQGEVDEHEKEDKDLRNQLTETTNQINNKLELLSIDIAEIKGQMRMIVPKITEKNALSVKTNEKDICINN